MVEFHNSRSFEFGFIVSSYARNNVLKSKRCCEMKWSSHLASLRNQRPWATSNPLIVKKIPLYSVVMGRAGKGRVRAGPGRAGPNKIASGRRAFGPSPKLSTEQAFKKSGSVRAGLRKTASVRRAFGPGPGPNPSLVVS